MELWIRSQDKEDLIEVHSVEVSIKDKIKIITLINSNTIIDLGNYKSKERALEVLDEIQSMISYEYNFENLGYQNADLILKGKILENMVKVYEMPKN